MDLLGELGDAVDVDRVVVAREDVGADLDHERPGVGDDLSADQVIHASRV